VKHDWQLTPREMKVLKLMRDGLSQKEIAAKMGTGIRVTKFHFSNIFRKFKVPDRLALHKVIGFHTSPQRKPQHRIVKEH
jgi:DNA-binding CsgD family transcriptional regulator